MAARKKMTVVAAVQRDLDGLAGDWATSGLAASALSLAAAMDDPDTTPTAKANCANRLQGALNRLLELAAPSGQAESVVDELVARREARRAR